MAQAGQRKCLCCGGFFDPDARNRKRQRYCAASACRAASKAASQAAWLHQPPNQDYFRDPMHVRRVQAWRAEHPGYSRGQRRGSGALQDPLIAQVADLKGESSIRTELPPTAGEATNNFRPADLLHIHAGAHKPGVVAEADGRGPTSKAAPHLDFGRPPGGNALPLHRARAGVISEPLARRIRALL